MEAAQPQPAPSSAAAEAVGGGGTPPRADSVVVHPHIYGHAPLKLPLPCQLQKALKKQIAGDEREAKSFMASLEQARQSLAAALESTSVSDAAVNESIASYVGLLLGLVTSSSGSSNGALAAELEAAAADTPDEALAAAEGGEGHGGAGVRLSAAPASKLRHSVQWAWGEAVLSPPPGSHARTAASNDAMFELASVLVAAAIRLMHAAALASADSASGVPTPASTRSYKLLREAAGMLEMVARDVLPALPPGSSADLDPQVLRALVSVALADAQQLTVLRAVQKGNAPSLIASLARDTAELYKGVGSQLGTAGVPGAASSKLWHYAQYKEAYCLAYAHTFAGIALWRADKPGEGLKSLEAAAGQLAAAKRASAGYDAAPPATLNLHHRRVDEELERILNDSQRRMERENQTVYIQRVAAEVPPLPAGKRLVSALPFALPPPAAAVKGGVVERCFAAGPAAPPGQAAAHAAGGSSAAAAAAAGGAAAGTAAAAGGHKPAGEGKQRGCSPCRWLAFAVAAPLLAILWVVGAVLWVLLLPLKTPCCLCIGVPLQWLVDMVLYLLRAPPRALLWATGGKEEKEAKKKKKAEA